MSIRWDARNKRWRFEFNRVIEGRRHRVSRLLPRGWSQAQADAFDRKEGARLYAVACGIERSDPLIDEAVMRYLQDRSDMKSHKATAEHLAAIAWAYAGKHMSQLAEVAASVTKAELARGMAPATVRNRLACLKAACRHAWRRHGLTEADPTGRMELPTVRNEKQAYYSRGEMLRACRQCVNWQTQVAARVAFYSGMRLGELMVAEPSGDVILLADSKNGEARAIPAHPKIRHLLRFLPLPGPKITIQRAWARACRAAGIEGKTFHDLRHSAASEMVNAGVPEATIGAVLGHRDRRSTKRYTHLRLPTLAEAVKTIGKKAA